MFVSQIQNSELKGGSNIIDLHVYTLFHLTQFYICLYVIVGSAKSPKIMPPK